MSIQHRLINAREVADALAKAKKPRDGWLTRKLKELSTNEQFRQSYQNSSSGETLPFVRRLQKLFSPLKDPKSTKPIYVTMIGKQVLEFLCEGLITPTFEEVRDNEYVAILSMDLQFIFLSHLTTKYAEHFQSQNPVKAFGTKLTDYMEKKAGKAFAKELAELNLEHASLAKRKKTLKLKSQNGEQFSGRFEFVPGARVYVMIARHEGKPDL